MVFLSNRRRLIASTIQLPLAAAFVNLGISSLASARPRSLTPRQVAESYWRAECARDIEKVGEHYHMDAIFSPPGEHLVGWKNIKGWYEKSFKQYPGLTVAIVHEITHGDEASLEWKAVLTDPGGGRHPLTGVNIVRVQEGRFREVRSYFDPGQLSLGKA